MSTRTHYKQIQGDSTRNQGDREYQVWQNLIEDETGVQCTVVVREYTLSIRTESYSDFVVAKHVLKNRTGLEIIRG